MFAREIDKLIDEYGTELYRFCLKLCLHKANAEDLYQQTFLRMMEIDVSLDWKDHPKTFLFSVAHSVWKNDVRKKARRERIAPTLVITDETKNYVADEVDVHEIVLDEIRSESLHGIILSLPNKFRIPVELYYSFTYSFAQIAAVQHVPVGTIKSRLAKARKIIKKRMEELGYESI